MIWIVIFLFLPGAAMMLFVVVQFLYRGKRKLKQIEPKVGDEDGEH